MAKKQTRRSISINRALFEQAKAVAECSNVSLSQFTEASLRSYIAAAKGPGASTVRSTKPIDMPIPSDGVSIRGDL